MKCDVKIVNCPPCCDGNKEKCLNLSGIGKLFKDLHNLGTGKISSLYALVFSDSICTTINLDLGEELLALTPPWEALGLSDSLGDFSFTLSNYSTHHALGTLADQLVQEGMLPDAAIAVLEDDRLRDRSADQKHSAVDNVKLG